MKPIFLLLLGLVASWFQTWPASARGGEPDTAKTSPAASSGNVVRLDGHALCDASGPFLGLGASYFQALRDAKYDRDRLHSNLSFLATNGFRYIRALSMVAWDGLEIAPVAFTNRNGRIVEAWPDYWPQLRDLLGIAGEHGLRVELTIFADAQIVMPADAARVQHMEGLLHNIKGRERHLIHLEVANEAWQNGFPGREGITQLRQYAKYLADKTEVLVAITSNDDTSDQGIISQYRGSAADLATVHFSRDTRSAEGAWLPVRDCYRAAWLPVVPPVTSNEPIGPGSSVGSESDPIKLVSAAAFAYLAGLPAYVFHCKAGIYGYEHCCPPSGRRLGFEEAPGITNYRALSQILPPDLPNWTRNDGIEPAAPFSVLCNGLPGKHWPEVAGATNGCVRNTGAVKGPAFISLPIGIHEGGLPLQARRAMHFDVIDPLTGAALKQVQLKPGERTTLEKGPGAWIIKGEFD